MEPRVPHQTSWLVSTGAFDVQQDEDFTLRRASFLSQEAAQLCEKKEEACFPDSSP